VEQTIMTKFHGICITEKIVDWR